MKQDNNRKMDALQAFSLRDLVNKVNSKGIQKEDIVQIASGENGFTLLYYI